MGHKIRLSPTHSDPEILGFVFLWDPLVVFETKHLRHIHDFGGPLKNDTPTWTLKEPGMASRS